MKLELPPLEKLLDRYNDPETDVRRGETTAELMKRLGLKNWDTKPELRPVLPPMHISHSESLEEYIQKLGKRIRQWLFGRNDLELAELAGIGNTPAELALTENKQELAKLKTRLTKFADRWDPQQADDPVYLEQLERIRAEFEGDEPPPKPKGRRP